MSGMSRLGLLIRYLIFCTFFAVGGTAMVVSFLVKPEMTDYLQSREMLEKTRRDNDKIRDLIDQYKSQIILIEQEPNVLKRLEQITLRQTPVQENTAYPSEYNAQLADMAREIIENSQPADPNEQIPVWMKRVIYPRYRTALCLSGAALILVAFMFFSGPRLVEKKKKTFYYR